MNNIISPEKPKILLSSNITSVFGDSSMGKSVFSLNLGNRTGQKVIHMDQLIFNNWREKHSVDYFVQNYHAALNNGNCIIDGNALDCIDERLNKSNALVFFDGDDNEIMTNFINRYKRIQAGLETYVGFPEIHESDCKTEKQIFTNAVNRTEKYIENKRHLKTKLIPFGNKLITIKNRNDLIALKQSLTQF